MDLLVTQWKALVIGIGSLIGAIWLWSGVRDWCFEYWTFLRKAALIDGPPALPIVGNALYFIGDVNEVLKKLEILTEIYTTSLRIWLGARLFIIISDPSDIEILLKSPHGTHKPIDYRFIENCTGPGLLTMSGPTHKIHRNLIMPMVNGKGLDKFINTFDTYSRRFVECLESHVNNGEFDIKPFTFNWATDISLDAIYGVPGIVQQGGHIELRELIIELNELSFERTVKMWLWPDWIYSHTRSGQKYFKGLAFAKKFTKELIAEKKKRYYDSNNSCNPPVSEQSAVVDQLIAYNEKYKVMDDVELRGEAATMFIAAVDPPTHIAAFTLLMLAMHPEIQDKVRAEVKEVISDGNVTVKNVAQLKYLKMVIKETIRLFPIGTIILRKMTDDIKFSSFTAPKSCTVGMFAYKTNRDPKSWKEPNKFDPDRFLPKNSVGRHPYAFSPFSSGVRACAGIQYAMLMISTVVIRTVQKYQLHSNGSLENLQVTSNLSIKHVDGYRVSITRL